jgi:ABC-type sugar transport system substrate-binding protein
MASSISRRKALLTAASGALAACGSPKNAQVASSAASGRKISVSPDEEYVWISANSNLPLFVAHDHPALRQAARELGVKVTIAGPDTIDIPGLVATFEQTAARKPAGIMVVGWDPSALVPAINAAIEAGIPVVCVDADVPSSKRLSFIGTDWHEIGVKQAEAILKALNGRKGRVAMLGLIEQYIDQQAMSGFRSVSSAGGLTVMEPQQDKGNQSEAARVASALLQANSDLVGIAGFDSESGAGIGQAIKESGKVGQVLGTGVDSEPQQLRFIAEGVLTASVGQKRALFTYQGLRALFDVVHNSLHFTSNDLKAGISPIPVYYNTGTFTVDKSNVNIILGSLPTGSSSLA